MCFWFRKCCSNTRLSVLDNENAAIVTTVSPEEVARATLDSNFPTALVSTSMASHMQPIKRLSRQPVCAFVRSPCFVLHCRSFMREEVFLCVLCNDTQHARSYCSLAMSLVYQIFLSYHDSTPTYYHTTNRLKTDLCVHSRLDTFPARLNVYNIYRIIQSM